MTRSRSREARLIQKKLKLSERNRPAPIDKRLVRTGSWAGRPTKLTVELLKKAEGYLDWCDTNPLKKVKQLEKDDGKTIEICEVSPRVPTLAGLAGFLEIDKITIYEWAKCNVQFSYLTNRIKNCAEQMLSENGLSGQWNPNMARFLLSSDHGKVEKTANMSEVHHTFSLSNLRKFNEQRLNHVVEATISETTEPEVSEVIDDDENVL
jgi:hypothetical protein